MMKWIKRQAFRILKGSIKIGITPIKLNGKVTDIDLALIILDKKLVDIRVDVKNQNYINIDI